jgi:glutamine synthetase
VALNALVTWGIDEVCTALEARLTEGLAFDAALQSVLSAFIREHKRILFDGDNYSEAWRQKAAKRGLPNAATTPEALDALIQPEVIELLSRYNILSERELRARHDIYLNGYRKNVLIEAECALGMVSTLIVPAGLAFADSLRTAADTPPIQRLRDRVNQLNDRLLIAAEQMEAAIAACAPEAALKIMTEARQAADELEGLVPAATWPLPSYAEMLLLV